MSVDPRTPCLVGVAQQTVRPAAGPAPEPLASWEQVARAAAADAGAPAALESLDGVSIVYCQSWQYDDPVARLAEALGNDPKQRTYSGIGGTVPLALLADAARAIGAGDSDSVLLVSAEALATKRSLKRGGERPAWSHRHPQPPPFPFEQMPVATEIAHEVFQAWETFPLFDVARRAARGVSLAAEAAERGAMFAAMTRVAAANPHAWWPEQRTADELVTPTPDNRYVGWPYTKRTVSVMDVDMAAAVLVMSTAEADRLGVPADRRIYLRGYAYAEDPWTVAAHPALDGSPAMAAAAAAALDQAGVGVDDLAAFDLYSCFASSVRFGCDALGLDLADPRGLTVTGGLPYAGGPASAYALHSVASMVDVLRRVGDAHGLVTGVGMHMTKHAYAVLSTQPGAPAPAADLTAPLPAPRPVADTHEGEAAVAAYTVAHARDGGAESGLLILDLPDGARAYARVRDPDLLADAESRELVGESVKVTTDGRTNSASW
ncbi:MAG TPA: acetyl-CoA synthetase [Mycobacteriales bacterium]|nr:acetyl-CoA synthetase [Mycobacteriales bacterium]